MTRVTLSDKATAIGELAANIEILDAEMKIKSDELLLLLRKKDLMTAALKKIAKGIV